MSCARLGTNPIATRFLTVHFFEKNPIFYKPQNLADFITAALGDSNQCELLTLG